MTTSEHATSHPFPAPESESVLAAPGHDIEAVALEATGFSQPEAATGGADGEVVDLTLNLRRVHRWARHMGVLPTRQFNLWPDDDTPLYIPPQVG